MGIPLANNRRVDIHHRSVRSLPHPVDRHSDAVRYLFFQTAQRFFPDHLCHDLTLRLIGDRIIIKIFRTIRQEFEDRIDDTLHINATQGADRNHIFKIIELAIMCHVFRKLFLVRHVDLIHNQDNRRFRLFELLCNVPLSFPDEVCRLYEPEHDIDLL